jgi:hypothetical protein
MGNFNDAESGTLRERIVLQTRRGNLGGSFTDRSPLAVAAQLALVAVWAITSSAAACAADRGQSFLQHVPQNACLTAYSGEVAATCTAFQKIALGKELSGPDFVPLIKELERLDWASPLHLRPAFGFDWSNLAAVRDPGGIAIFRLADEAAGAAWIFTSESPLDKPPEVIAAATKFFTARGYRATNEQRPQGTLTVLAPPDAKTGSPRALFVAKGYYGAANSQAAAEAILSVTAENSLAEQPAFKELPPADENGSSRSAAEVHFRARPLELNDLLTRSHQKTAESQKNDQATRRADSEEHSAKMHRLGLDALDAIGGRVRFTPGEPIEWQVEAGVHAPGPYRGISRLFALEPGPMPEIPAWLRGDMVSVAMWRWDFVQAMKGFGTLYDESNEPGPDGEGMFEDMLDALRDDPEGVHVDLRRNVFDQVLPEMLRVTAGGPPLAADEPPALHTLFVAPLRDTAKVRDTFASFYKDDAKVRHVRQGDFDVWSVDKRGSLFVEGESDSLVTVRALAVGDGKLLFSTDTDLLTSTLKPPAGAAIGNDASWSRLLEDIKTHQDATTAFRSLVRLGPTLEGAYHLATAQEPTDKDPLGTRLWRLLLFGTIQASAELPRALAPKYDRLRDALPPAATMVSRTEGGWTLRLVVLAPGPESSR